MARHGEGRQIDEIVMGLLLAGALAGLAVMVVIALRTETVQPPRIVIPPPAFSLALSEDGGSVHVSGPIDPGITAALEALLTGAPGVRALVLESDGGRIAEARGLIRLVREHGLATRVERDCLSACALVFAAAQDRALESAGRLGFHSYALRSQTPIRVIDVAAEQRRDLEGLRAAGVSAEFVDRIAETPPQEMWFPTRTELRSAGILPVVPAR